MMSLESDQVKPPRPTATTLGVEKGWGKMMLGQGGDVTDQLDSF